MPDSLLTVRADPLRRPSSPPWPTTTGPRRPAARPGGERPDRTNWAVGTTAAFLGFSFSHPEITHSAFLFGLAMIYVLLVVEARRFRFYDAYEYRVRLIHQNFVHSILAGRMDHGPTAPWRKELAQDLLHPRYKISRLQAPWSAHPRQLPHLSVCHFVGRLVAENQAAPLTSHSWRQY
ncbi:MAG: DUF2270 domain-containing protein [Syntrophotaleaceae bacterium]